MSSRSRTTILSLLAFALFTFATTSANALAISIVGGSIAIANSGTPHTIDASSFSDFDLDCASATQCDIVGFWFGNGSTHIASDINFGQSWQWGMTDSGGNLLDPTYPYSNGTSTIALTLDLGTGHVTSDTQFVETFLVSGGFPDPGVDMNFALSTDGSTLPVNPGNPTQVGCPDLPTFFDVTAPIGSQMTNGFNLGSTGTLVGIGCYTPGAPINPMLITLDIEVVVPEPSTALLLAGGLGGIAWFGRRRR